jgi:hypothetical protein
MSQQAEWTLEGELQKLAGSNSTRAALRALGLLDNAARDFSVVSSPDGWVRSGAETYLYKFRVRADQRELSVVLKACVAFSPVITLEAILAQWYERRRMLAACGVRTPKLYACDQGEVLEEEVPYELNDILTRPEGVPESILLGLAELAGVVANLGFLPIGLFNDLRSHGDDVVMVDFGQDLGPPHVAKDENRAIFDELIKYLNGKGVVVSDVLRTRLQSLFEAQRHLGLN